MHFPNSFLLAFVLTSLLLNPSSGVEAKLQPKPFGNEVQDVTQPGQSNNFDAKFVGARRRRSYDEKSIRFPKPQLECDPGHPVRGCVPPAAAAEAAKLSKRSPLQISNDEGNPHPDGGQVPGDGAKGDKTVLLSGGLHHSTKDNDHSNFPSDPKININPSMITITSNLSATFDQPGFLGICELPFSPNDGVVHRTDPHSPVSKFLDVAKKTARCTYVTDSDINCIEKGGAQDMKEGDYTWWEQAFCKRCVDAGGVSRPEFACPDGYSHGDLEQLKSFWDNPIVDSTPRLNKVGVKTGDTKGTDDPKEQMKEYRKRQADDSINYPHDNDGPNSTPPPPPHRQANDDSDTSVSHHFDEDGDDGDKGDADGGKEKEKADGGSGTPPGGNGPSGDPSDKSKNKEDGLI